MEQPPPEKFWKTKSIFVAISFVVVAAGAGTLLYYDSRLQDVPPFPLKAPQSVRPAARMLVATPSSGASGVNTPSERPSPPSDVPARPSFHVEGDPLGEFRQDLNQIVLREVGPAFPELHTVLGVRTSKSNDPRYRSVVFQLLDAAAKMPADERPPVLFAADLVAQNIWCDMGDTPDIVGPGEGKAKCDQLRADFARYDLTLSGASLGGVYIYPHDLLWRLWQDYPETDWGERALILLLDSGWDTSGTCQKGADQFREVIHQGETFLQLRPGSSYRAVVTSLVAEAYASWWSLGSESFSEHADPSQPQQDAEKARLKAITDFEKVAQLAPGTKLAEFALQVLPALRDRKVLDNQRFLCVYD